MADDKDNKLLNEIKNYLEITWDDSLGDEKIRGMVKRGMAAIMFENIAYVMAQHADPENVPPDIMDWLEQFNTFSIYQILPAILELWNMNEETKSQAKKNLDRVAGS